MIENAAVMGISAKDALESFLNGSQQQRKDSRIAEYKTELMARLTAQVDEWLVYEVLPYLKKQDTVYQNAANRNIAETGMRIQLAREQIADSMADLRMLPDRLSDARRQWGNAIQKTLGDKNELRESLRKQMIDEINSRSTGNDKKIDKYTFFGKLKSWGKEQGFYRDENDEETKNIRIAFEIVKNRILHIAEEVNYNAGVEYEKIINMIRICDQTAVESINKASCELSIGTPQLFRESLASFSAYLQDFLKQQSLSQDPEAMRSLSDKFFFGNSETYVRRQISAIQTLSAQEEISFPEHLAEMISGDFLFLRDEEFNALGNMQSGSVNFGSVDDICYSKTFDLVQKLFDMTDKRFAEIDFKIVKRPEVTFGETIIMTNSTKGLTKTIVKDHEFRDFPGMEEDEIWLSEWTSKNPPANWVRYRTEIVPQENGSFLILWEIQPDGRYWADEGGYGWENNKEIRLYSTLDDKGRFLHPFRLYSIGNNDFDFL